MAYEPTTWKSGDVVTSAKLNKMEQGIAGAGPLVIGFSSFDPDSEEGTLDHTWQEIHDAMASGRHVMVSYSAETSVDLAIVNACWIDDDNGYVVKAFSDDFYASSPDGYPSNESHAPGPDPIG